MQLWLCMRFICLVLSFLPSSLFLPLRIKHVCQLSLHLASSSQHATQLIESLNNRYSCGSVWVCVCVQRKKWVWGVVGCRCLQTRWSPRVTAMHLSNMLINLWCMHVFTDGGGLLHHVLVTAGGPLLLFAGKWLYHNCLRGVSVFQKQW